jgi:predicted DNA repair protein MutK
LIGTAARRNRDYSGAVVLRYASAFHAFPEPCMAGASLLTLLDDIATLLDDVAVLSKVAAKKTAGVLGDDLALNAEQVTGVRAQRELPVVWAVFKGSALNKLIMVPIALLLSAFLPWVITPLLMLGGAFLCYEGFEKVAHRLLHSRAEDRESHAERVKAVADREVDMVEFEKKRIRGAIRTDAILSAEIIVIVLGTVQDAPLPVRIGVLSLLAVLITIGIYGLVAGIVRMDDVGMRLLEKTGDNWFTSVQQAAGRMLLRLAPKLMKALSILGTAAMFLVGGGILVHAIPLLASMLHSVEHLVTGQSAAAGALRVTAAMLFNGIAGILTGAILVGIHSLASRVLSKTGGGQETEH